MKRSSLLFFLVMQGVALAGMPMAALAQVPAIGLREAVSRALARDPGVERARQGVEIGGAEYRQARSLLFPVVQFNAQSLYKKDALNVGNPRFGGESYNFYQLGFQAVQPVFRGGGVLAGISAAKKQKTIRELELELLERDLTKAVIQAYYRVLLNETRLRLLKKARDLDEKRLKTARQRHEIGREQLSDVLQIKTQVALLAPEIQAAENDLELSVAELANLLGDRKASEIALRGTLPRLDLTGFVDDKSRLRGRLPEFERMLLLQEQFSEQKRVQLAAHFPQLNAVAVMGRSAFAKAELLDQYSSSWSLGAELVIPLFSGLSSLQDRAKLGAQEAQLESDRRALEDQIALNQIRAEKDLELARRQIDSWALASRYASEALEEAEKSYRLQTFDYFRLLQAQRNHLEAQMSFEKAKYDAIVALGNFHVFVGFPIGNFLDSLDSSKM